jgi:hypothetical protein
MRARAWAKRCRGTDPSWYEAPRLPNEPRAPAAAEGSRRFEEPARSHRAETSAGNRNVDELAAELQALEAQPEGEAQS